MATNLVQTTVLQSLTAGNQPVSQIDADLSQLYTALNTLNSFSNFYLDSGSANALAITVNPSYPTSFPQVITLNAGALVAGLILQVYALHTNTGPSTLTVTYNGASLGLKAITYQNWNPLIGGEIQVGAMLILMYDGTRFQLLNPARVEELSYAQFTGVVSISATTEATANQIVAASAITLDGSTTIVIEFFAPFLTTASADTVTLVLYDGASSIGKLGVFLSSAGILTCSAGGNREFAPANGSHTYSVRGYVTTNPGSVVGGVGGVGNLMPGYIKITRA